MQTYIAMLRGINVNGQKMIRMTDLKTILTDFDLKNIRTYIQSGNLVFEYPEIDQKVLARLIEQKIWQHYKFEVPVIIRNRTELLKIVEKNPFLKRNEDINRLHVTFLDIEPQSDLVKKTNETERGSDEFEVIGKEVFLFCTNGYGNTKLNNTFFEKKFKVKATTRNWKTVLRLGVI
jgi:uncharacterized protein (DUF1697 family)